MQDDDDYIELHSNEEGETFEYRNKPIQPWKARLIFWSVLIGGIAVGTLLFLTFISLFIYFFVPIVFILSIWYLVRMFLGRR